MTQLSNIMHKEHDGFFYVYFENYDDDCNCKWRKNSENENVYNIERVDILSEFRRKGFARVLLTDAIKRIAVECPQACIEILAKPEEDSGVTVENLVAFYESLGFEKHLDLKTYVNLRLYLDDSAKPDIVYDYPLYFKYVISNKDITSN
ncbi:GNAT family N-acetyltransferase [Paraglaciecola arctica]|uniref:GNAT family N-acetyltransferase n=1 Tax=Paraglaciecola arctica TaxID=1128911 RepID=UPI001C06548A|nr:GNAT family N-acetyltransferase [Paraglaciecola arctica]MBU3005953.1 GNAT family N-acetyltransferase [Paraglaciecola arctica]